MAWRNYYYYYVFLQTYRAFWYCGGISINFLTHTIHTHKHNCMCTEHCFSAYVNWLQPAACLLLHCTLVTHTRWPTLQLPNTRYSAAVFIRLQCVGDAMSWLSGWASLWHPPQYYQDRNNKILKTLFKIPLLRSWHNVFSLQT